VEAGAPAAFEAAFAAMEQDGADATDHGLNHFAAQLSAPGAGAPALPTMAGRRPAGRGACWPMGQTPRPVPALRRLCA
jgi:hypothetical protein